MLTSSNIFPILILNPNPNSNLIPNSNPNSKLNLEPQSPLLLSGHLQIVLIIFFSKECPHKYRYTRNRHTSYTCKKCDQLDWCGR